MTTEPITRQSARAWLRQHISETARIPHDATCYWVTGIQYAAGVVGLYTVAGEGGMCGVYIAKVSAQAERRAG